MRRRGEEGGSRMRWQMRWWWRQCTPCPGWNDHVFGWLLQIKALHYFFPIKFFINQKTIQHLQCFAFCNWEALLSISIQIWGKTFAAQKNVVIPRGKGRKQPAVLGIVFGLRAVSCLPPGTTERQEKDQSNVGYYLFYLFIYCIVLVLKTTRYLICFLKTNRNQWNQNYKNRPIGTSRV
jgi:hypothetical protein